MLKYVFDLAKEKSIKSVRLSIIENNVPAERVYKKLAFEYVDTISVKADERGLKTFNLYEKLI
jgi:RimJ/RimL family protein N-acetyltransferase